MTTSNDRSVRVRLQKQLVCPHCWHSFTPDAALWISQHSDLMGDPRIGDDQPRRFLPTRFNSAGQAIDPRGLPCSELACPSCHLGVPRAMFELPTSFWSILGSPASGKSYLLAAMSWTLRKVLPQYFSASFSDVDPLTNRILNEYEEMLFLSSNPDEIVAIRKTETQGDLYSTVRYGDRTVNYPQPFIFSTRALPGHPNEQAAGKRGRVLCLYDNAGEHFLPGQDSAASPATRHLAHSRGMFFLFDPMQDPRFREICQGYSDDPQLAKHSRTMRQEAVLQEAANRVRRFTGLPEHERHNRPLIIIVTKYDVWHELLGSEPLSPPWVKSKSGRYALNLDYINRVSKALRAILWKYTPELVSVAEAFAERVYFLPCSATGVSPEVMPDSGLLGIRANHIKPIWAEVPMTFALSQFTRDGLVSGWQSSKSEDNGGK
ncbi:MAG: hypothetical protein ACI9G1_000329 [Pirellulaceae bacterium]|jgi:hypothetical protein